MQLRQIDAEAAKARMLHTQAQRVDQIKELLLADDGEFDDAHTADAAKLADIAEILGLRVVRERDQPTDERRCASDCTAPVRIEAP